MPQDNEQQDETRQRIMARWPAIPADEVERASGNREALLELLRTRAGLDPQAADRALDLMLSDHAMESRGLEDIPSVAGEPPDAANAVTGKEYAAGEQGAHRIGDEGTPMADSSTPELPSMAEDQGPRQGDAGTEPPVRRAG